MTWTSFYCIFIYSCSTILTSEREWNTYNINIYVYTANIWIRYMKPCPYIFFVYTIWDLFTIKSLCKSPYFNYCFSCQCNRINVHLSKTLGCQKICSSAINSRTSLWWLVNNIWLTLLPYQYTLPEGSSN